jgi:hypothetical protein
MRRIFAIHEYELRHDTDSQEFESILKDTLLSKELDMLFLLLQSFVALHVNRYIRFNCSRYFVTTA